MLDENIYHGRFWSDSNEMYTFLHRLATKDEACILPTGVDAAFLHWLELHELAAFTYARLDKSEDFSSQLAPIYWSHVSANTMKLALLESLLSSFNEIGIKCVLLKGIAFCLTIYTDTAVRPMSDLDLWIQRADWPRAWQIMRRLGYETDKLWDSMQAIPEHVTTLEFFPRQAMQEDFLSVEIHSDLVAHPTHLIGRLPLASWWQEAVTHTWRSQTIHLLNPAAALLHTAVHQMFQHRGQLRLRWLLDIDQLARGTDNYYLTTTDWQRLGREATQAGVLPAVQSALQLCQKWFSTPLPQSAHTLLQQTVPSPQQAFFQQAVAPQQSSVGKVWVDLQGIPNSRQRFSLLRQKLFPGAAYMIERYQISSPLLLPFYYLKRLGKGISIIWQRQ